MTNYPSNLSDSQWQYISNFLDTKRKRKHELREVFNGILYLLKTGCQWRMLPRDFPDWHIVYYYLSSWKKSGLISVLQEALVEKTRQQNGRKDQPTAGIIDAQSVKSTLVSSESKGFDEGKKIKGIKRYIIVDTLGLVLCCSYTKRIGTRQGWRYRSIRKDGGKLEKYYQNICRLRLPRKADNISQNQV